MIMPMYVSRVKIWKYNNSPVLTNDIGEIISVVRSGTQIDTS